jgi:hypothetical protein
MIPSWVIKRRSSRLYPEELRVSSPARGEPAGVIIVRVAAIHDQRIITHFYSVTIHFLYFTC